MREADLDPKKLNLDTCQINFSSPVHVKCSATRIDRDVFLKCEITAMTRQICSCCLKEFDIKLTKKIDLYYESKGQISVELDDDLKDEIMVDYPMKVLCSGGCKGLCPKCGKDLNEGECGCPK